MISERGNIVGTPWSTLIKPSCPISIGARATHHITDEELAGAPTMTELLLKRGLPEYGQPAQHLLHDPQEFELGIPKSNDVVFVAHNAGYDRRMLVQSGVHPDLLPKKTICTWRCALHLFPDAPGYKNQELRYYLGVEPTFKTNGPPHRALPDVAVTSGILLRMLETQAPERLIELTQLPVLLKTVRFGQYAGRLWQDMDAGWLRWVLDPKRSFGEDEKFTAKRWLEQKSKPRLASMQT